MRKPSIFSRDYERKMRQRRRRIALISMFIFIVIGAIFLKVTISNINMQELRNNLQSWIDSGTENNNKDIVENNELEETKEQEVIETPKEPEVKTKDLKVSEGVLLKAEYEEVNGELKFKGIQELPDKFQYDINPSKNMIVLIDDNQNMKLFNIDGNEASITKDSYTAPNGEVFNKDSVLSIYQGYLWNAEAKFITDTKIAYISNVPYFGYDLNKYIWIVDLNNNTHTTLWNSKAKDIKFGDLEEKGLKLSIDGSEKFLDSNGNLIN